MDQFLSIVIPVYKIQEQYLRMCFDSLLEQDMAGGFQVLVIDDGSPDQCGDICEEYARRDNRFMVFHQENAGVSAARNRGLESVQTDWVIFVDPDDWVEPDLVSTLFQAKEIHDADIFFYDYYQEFATRHLEKKLKETKGMLPEEWVTAIRIAPFNHLVINGRALDYEVNVIWNKMYRTDLIRGRGVSFVVEARKGQDSIFNAELLQCTSKFYYLQRPLYHYRYIEESITNRFNEKTGTLNDIMLQNHEQVLKKYSLGAEYWAAHYARTVTLLYSQMRLYYFHPKNNMTRTEIRKELDQLLIRSPYREALEQEYGSQLTTEQKVFVFFLRRQCYGILHFLVNGRLWLIRLKGHRLG